jgi:hypothetical protein
MPITCKALVLAPRRSLTHVNAARPAGATLTGNRTCQEPAMSTLRTITTTTLLAFTLGACAQMPGGTTAAPPASTERMAVMDAHMKSMHEMHDKMSRASTPEQRQALMVEHMKLMHDGMAMMDGMHGRQGMGGMGPMGGVGAAPADMPGRMQMMEKHMEMMQSMMQMMMDQMGPPAGKR